MKYLHHRREFPWNAITVYGLEAFVVAYREGNTGNNQLSRGSYNLPGWVVRLSGECGAVRLSCIVGYIVGESVAVG